MKENINDKKDLIISVATTRYTKDQLYNYVESINRWVYYSDKIMVIYDVNDETIDYLKDNGWELFRHKNLKDIFIFTRLITNVLGS